MNKLNRLKASVDKMHNLASEYEEIPTDGVLIPISQTPAKREIGYYRDEALKLINEWIDTIEDDDIIKKLRSIKSNLQNI